MTLTVIGLRNDGNYKTCLAGNAQRPTVIGLRNDGNYKLYAEGDWASGTVIGLRNDGNYKLQEYILPASRTVIGLRNDCNYMPVSGCFGFPWTGKYMVSQISVNLGDRILFCLPYLPLYRG